MAKSDTLGGGITTKVFLETDLDEGEAIKLSATTLYSVSLTNASSSTTTYLKFYDTAGTVTIGTTVPVFTVPCRPDLSGEALVIGTGGLAFSNGLQIATVTDGGGTAGTTAPSDALTVTLVFS